MQFVFETLRERLEQRVNLVSEDRIQVAAIIPYLYVNNLQAGTFLFSVLREDLSLVFEKEFTASELNAELTEVYGHIYYPIVPSVPFPLEAGEYTFKLESATGYSPTPESFLGWIKQHEDIQLTMAYTPENDSRNTFTIRFKEYKGIHDGKNSYVR